jgi:hypothetical protein
MGTSQSIEDRVYSAARQGHVPTLVNAQQEYARAARSTSSASSTGGRWGFGRQQELRQAPPPEAEVEAGFRRLINKVNSATGMTALHAACTTGGATAVSWLLANGADPNIPVAVTGNTALHLVARSTNSTVRAAAPQIVAALLNAGVVVDMPNNHRRTALDFAREVPKTVLNAAQVLRTMEVNCALWHGALGIEEHGDLAKFAGSMVSLLWQGGGSGGGNTDGGGTRSDPGKRARDSVSSWTGGVYKARWGLLTGPRLGSSPELVLYDAFGETRPTLRLATVDATLGPIREQLARPGARLGTKKMSSPWNPLIGSKNDSKLRGVPPEDILVRATIVCPQKRVNLQLAKPVYEALQVALARVRTDVHREPSGTQNGANNSRRRGGQGAAEAETEGTVLCYDGGGGTNPVVAVPMGADDGAMGYTTPFAEAVVLGPADSSIVDDVTVLGSIDDPASTSLSASSCASTCLSSTATTSLSNDNTFSRTLANETSIEGLTEEEMIQEAIRRSCISSNEIAPAQDVDLPLPPQSTVARTTADPATTTNSKTTATTVNAMSHTEARNSSPALEDMSEWPYQGNLQEAMRSQDREAIRFIMRRNQERSQRQQQRQQEEEEQRRKQEETAPLSSAPPALPTPPPLPPRQQHMHQPNEVATLQSAEEIEIRQLEERLAMLKDARKHQQQQQDQEESRKP